MGPNVSFVCVCVCANAPASLMPFPGLMFICVRVCCVCAHLHLANIYECVYRIYGVVDYYKMNGGGGIKFLIDLLYESRSVYRFAKNRNGRVHVELWPHHVLTLHSYLHSTIPCWYISVRAIYNTHSKVKNEIRTNVMVKCAVLVVSSLCH